jgi:hypothetical protein
MNRAEQPVQFTSVRECETWLATLSPQEKAAQPPLQRLLNAVKCLQAPPSRQRRTDIQRIAKDWAVVQYSRVKMHHAAECSIHGGKKQKTYDVAEELEAKVLREATRLRRLQLRGFNGGSSSSWSAVHHAFANP